MTRTDQVRWVRDDLGGGLSDLWRIDDVLWEGRTEFQHVLVARTGQGTTLFCDGNPQSTELGQLAFHEALSVPALLLARNARSALIVGSSEGVIPQIAVSAGIGRVDHVDIDRECVEVCAEHLPFGFTPDELAAAEKRDGAVRLHYADGLAFVQQAGAEGTRYDVVVLDLPEEHEDNERQHNRLYSADFLADCRGVLTEGGVLAVQICRPALTGGGLDLVRPLAAVWERFDKVFDTTVYFRHDEQPWGVILFGVRDALADPVSLMIERLPRLAYRPGTLDADTLRKCAVPPLAFRRSRAVTQSAR
ncbi:polyamine aminopropyltransferase [Longimycelium tulufanense]|uniref:Polyamine aminopropyltransferase n=1 Tax=Longimycelium tulufanense TaxID=907463 RepID=A0A8J3CK12_9PSEU|nr:spermidine synthase [Longimycelium tulufanense]GGM79041.1 polyamine aminopropyltransferase [Longimycelium tulufanense]